MSFRGPDGRVDLARRHEPATGRLHGAALSMGFQEPMTALDPVLTVGDPLAEPLMSRRNLDLRAARAFLDRMRPTDPRRDACRAGGSVRRGCTFKGA